MKKTIKLLTLSLAFTGLLISCSENFLDQPPIGAFGETSLSNAKGIDQLLIGAYTDLNGKWE